MSPPGWFFTLLVGMEALHVALPGSRWLDLPWTLLGVAPLGAGILLHAWSTRVFRAAGTTMDPAGRPERLVRSGPYARTRNPMYLAGLPILTGVALLLGTTTPALALVAYAVGARRWVAREETGLSGRFGADWEAYRATVPRWL